VSGARPTAIDLQDERLIRHTGLRGGLEDFVMRVRGGDLGSLPVVVGLVIICVVFQLLNPNFLSSANLVNITMQMAAVGTVSLGVVLVLLLGEIDLSVGSVSGLAAAILAVTWVQFDWPLPIVLVLAVGAGALVGVVYGILRTRFGVPSFVITLAGLLGVLGVQLLVLGTTGSINIPDERLLVQFAQQWFLPPWLSYTLVLIAAVTYAWKAIAEARRRAAVGLSTTSIALIAVRTAGMLAVLGVAAWYLNLSRGVGAMFMLFIVLVVIAHLALTRTRWGRSVFAVGGNVEAARRAGIRVNRVYVSVFVLCSTLAALGGILAAARLGAANQSSGGGDFNLNAIAAAVIGGTSLFGGRGSAFSALLGVLVITAISVGLSILNLESSIRYIITGAVLLLAVVIDSLSRRSRAASGRA
jgi:D-xylose transport system permease protein